MSSLSNQRSSQFFTKYFLYINYVFVLALGLAYLSCFVSPEKAWGLSFFGLLYPVLLIINLIFILFWIYYRKYYFLISLIVILVGIKHISKFVQFTTTDELTSAGIKILTFNAQNFSKEQSGTFDLEIQQKAFDFLKKQNADIVCIQEYSYEGENKYASHAQLRDILMADNYLFESYFQPKDKRIVGMVTFSRYPIVGKGIFSINETRKFGLYTDLKIGKDTIRLYNIHLESIRLNKGDYEYLTMSSNNHSNHIVDSRKIIEKLSQAYQKRGKQVDVLKHHITSSPYPKIICGDFNDTPVSYTYHQLSQNMSDAFIDKGRGISKTLKGKIPAFRIDYVLFDQSFKCENYQEIDLDISDHYPVSVRLAFK